MPSPFDQDDQPTAPHASEWPTRPDWPARPMPAAPPTPTASPTLPSTPVPPAPGAPSAWQPQPAAPPVWQAHPAGPPMGPPPIPPSGRPGPEAPRPRRTGWTSSGSRAGLAVALVVALIVGATAGGVASRAVLTSSGADTDSAATAPLTPTQGSSAPTTTVPEQGSSGGPGSTSGSSGQMTSWGDVVEAITVGVVNIQSQMGGGVGAGTGMVLSDDGEILTNNHVVEGASAIVVTVVTTGESYRASVVGTDPEEDVAVLQLQGAADLETIPLGDSDTVAVGDQVAAIGNAGGAGGDPAVATGEITALDQQITASDEDGGNVETLTGMIQVDAEVVPGDSGGPLASTDGEVIGMNTAAAVSGYGGSPRFRGGNGTGEGYAIPINDALDIAGQLKATGQGASAADGSTTSGSGGFLGVQVTVGVDGGAEIVSVANGSPADAAGLAAGDTIVGLGRSRILTPDELVTALSELEAGDRITLTFVDPDGTTRQAVATLATR